jgi:hypothetical protein
MTDYFEKATEFETKRLQASKHADQIVQELAAAQRDLSIQRDLTTPLTEDAKAIPERYEELFRTFSDGIAKLQEDVRLTVHLLEKPKPRGARSTKQPEKHATARLKSWARTRPSPARSSNCVRN